MTDKEIEEVKTKYQLSEEEFEEMYEEAKRLIIGNRQPSKGKPTAIVTGGQPGAGKIGLVLKSKRDFKAKSEEVVVLDSDIYRGLYKKSMEIAEKYPELYSEITDKATGKITNRLLNELIQNGYDFIFEGTMAKINIIDSLKASPIEYNIIARLIATSREESLLSVFERYALMIENMGIGRLATIEAHDRRYESFTEVAKELERRDIEVEVYERSESLETIAYPILLYKTSSSQNIYHSVQEALAEGRKKSYKKCKANILERLQELNKKLKGLAERNLEFKTELDKLNEILTRGIEENNEER